MRHTPLLGLAVLLMTGCASPAPERRAAEPPARSTSPTSRSTPSSAPVQSATTASRSSTVPRGIASRPSSTAAPRASTPTSTRPPGLKDDTRNAFAFAPLSSPGAVTVEGSVPSSRAWSTSKVLVAAAFLDTVVDGDPDRASAEQRRWITRALTESDMDSVLALRDQIPGSPGAAITAVLRSIGDLRTVAPDRSQGSMQWSLREQVRFMAALHAGRVVSPKASAYLLQTMQPIAAHRWGLGTVGPLAFKGGWLRSDTETRQMGIVDGYAVAIITAGVGPAVLQTDGDSAHVQQMNRLAKLLKARLAAESAR